MFTINPSKGLLATRAFTARMFSVQLGNIYGVAEGLKTDQRGNMVLSHQGIPKFRATIKGHMEAIVKGQTYTGMGLKDLKRRLKHWEERVAAVKAMTADAVGPAKGKATKLINSGEKLLATIREEIASRQAA